MNYPKCPSHISEKDWLKYNRLKAQEQKLRGKWAAIYGRRSELLFDVALIAGSKVHDDGESLMQYYLDVAKPAAEADPTAYNKVVAEVVKQKADEALELDGRLAEAWARYVAKMGAREAWAEKINAPKEEA